MLIGGAAAAVLVLVVVGFLVLRGGGGSGGSLPNEANLLAFVSPGSGPTSEPEEMKWSTDCDGYCSIAADADRVYVLDSTDDESTLSAYAKSDGKESWKVDDLDGGGSLLVVEDTVLMSTTDSESREKTIAYAASSGEQRWKKDFSFVPFGTGSTVLLHETGDGLDYGELVAVDLKSGSQKWKSSGMPAGVCASKVVVVEGDYDDPKIVVHDLSSGEERMSVSADDLRDADCSDDGVFVLADGEISAYPFDESKPKWTKKAKDADAVDAGGGLVYVTDSDEVTALDVSDGEKKWDTDGLGEGDDSDSFSSAATALSMSSSTVIVSGSSRERAVELSSGEEVGSRSLRSFGEEAIGSNGYYVLEGETLHLYGWSDLKEKWSVDLDEVDDDDFSDIAVGGGYVFVVTDGEIQAYR